MAIENISIEELPAFGRRLMELAREKEIGSPLLLAEALYHSYRDLVEPAQRKNKHGKVVKDSKHDIEAIKRMVQRHFNEENAYNIQSKYLYAYSMLFDCSLDFLYGNTKVRCCDLEVRDICNKLHIDERAITNFIDGYDSDPEAFSPTLCWSELLSTNMFDEIPSAWLRYSMEVLQYKDLEKKIEAIKKAEISAADSNYRIMMEARRNSLEKMQPWKKSNCEGAFGILLQIITMYIDAKTESWVASKHTDLAENYYDNELKKIELLEATLKEGSEPIK